MSERAGRTCNWLCWAYKLRPAQAELCAHPHNRPCRQLLVASVCKTARQHGRVARRAHLCRACMAAAHTAHVCNNAAVVCVVLLQVRIIEAAKEKLQKDMRSSSSKNLAAMVSVQA